LEGGAVCPHLKRSGILKPVGPSSVEQRHRHHGGAPANRSHQLPRDRAGAVCSTPRPRHFMAP